MEIPIKQEKKMVVIQIEGTMIKSEYVRHCRDCSMYLKARQLGALEQEKLQTVSPSPGSLGGGRVETVSVLLETAAI